MKVLIVDDNRALAENIGEFLEDEGHRVRLAGEAAGAMALVGKCAGIEFVLIDICLGKDDGVALAEQIRQTRPDLRVALMTAYTSEVRVTRAESLALGPIFPKPVPLDALVRLLVA